jgi:ectoine hydroxylase-related dioxygenase (phytanoyl-CoA dioxygenase family)
MDGMNHAHAMSESEAEGLRHQRHLRQLGIHPQLLNEVQRQSLDREGYLVLPNVLSISELDELRAAFDSRMQAVYARIPTEAQRDRHLTDMVNASPACDRLWTHPLVLAAVDHVLNRPYKLSSLNGRDPLRGHGEQALHCDWGARRADDPFHVVNSLWLLDDFLPDNGATRLVPGSHLETWDPTHTTTALDAHGIHPRQLLLQGVTGSVVVINAHLLHGGTANRGTARRRVLHGYFTAREHAQQLDQRACLRVVTQQRLSSSQRWILDVD